MWSKYVFFSNSVACFRCEAKDLSATLVSLMKCSGIIRLWTQLVLMMMIIIIIIFRVIVAIIKWYKLAGNFVIELSWVTLLRWVDLNLLCIMLYIYKPAIPTFWNVVLIFLCRFIVVCGGEGFIVNCLRPIWVHRDKRILDFTLWYWHIN
jgi:hypothetical protein